MVRDDQVQWMHDLSIIASIQLPFMTSDWPLRSGSWWDLLTEIGAPGQPARPALNCWTRCQASSMRVAGSRPSSTAATTASIARDTIFGS